MSEDFTYEPVQTVTIRRKELAQLQQRIAELEAQLACVDDYGAYAQAQGQLGWPVYKFEFWYLSPKAPQP